MNDDALKTMSTSKRCQKKSIKNDSIYNILDNYRYGEAFQFLSVDKRNEEEDGALSDMIAKAVNLDDFVIREDGEVTLKPGADQMFANSKVLLKLQHLSFSETNRQKMLKDQPQVSINREDDDFQKLQDEQPEGGDSDHYRKES